MLAEEEEEKRMETDDGCVGRSKEGRGLDWKMDKRRVSGVDVAVDEDVVVEMKQTCN